jgi:translation initiation factor 2 alpha subunit (eIF-2alpha)
MENHIDLDKKRVQAEEILKIIKDYKEKSNKDLQTAMEFINEDFKITKESIIKLTHHLDALENTYNLIHKEYTERIKSK